MSRDIIVQDLPAGARRVEDIPDDFEPRALGPRAGIVAGILAVVPEADFTDPAWGRIDGPGWSIEVNVPQELCESFTLHVRGEGADPVIARILRRLGPRALDGDSESGFFEGA